MSNPICPEHQTESKLVPAGKSKKTGNVYPAFWVCSITGKSLSLCAAAQPAPTVVQSPKPELPGSPDAELRLRAALGALDAAVRLVDAGCEPSTVLHYANSFYSEFLAPIVGLSNDTENLGF